jgi:hypothetical protein
MSDELLNVSFQVTTTTCLKTRIVFEPSTSMAKVEEVVWSLVTVRWRGVGFGLATVAAYVCAVE